MKPRAVRLIKFVSVSAVLLAAGCQTTPRQTETLLLFPPPPERPRFQFLTWATSADEVERSRGSFERFVLGDEPMVSRAINKPYGMAARDGVLYVCDTKGLCLCRLDYRNKSFTVLGASGPGRLRKPINIIIDPLGYKFVADPERKQIVVFGPDDEYVTAFDLPAPCRPVDVALYENELFVLDNDETCQVVVLNRQTGELLRTFGGPGGEPGEFKIPSSLCTSPDGHLYVSDTHNWRIQKLTRDGEPVWVRGEPGHRIGEFGRPKGIRTGPDGVIYVVDAATEMVQLFDAEGHPLMRLAGPGNAPGALGLPSSVAIDTTSLADFQQYIHKDFKAEYLVFAVSQYGDYLVNVYAFGSFPEGYKLSQSQIAVLPAPPEKGIGPVNGEDAAAPEPPMPHSMPSQD